MALMPIQLAADMAPNGSRHSCIGPDTRPPPPRLRPSWLYVVSQTVRKHRTWRHRPLATACMAAMTLPPGPGTSMPPLCHTGWMRSASSTAVTPPSPMPIPVMPPG